MRYLISIMFFVFILVGCGDDDNPTENGEITDPIPSIKIISPSDSSSVVKNTDIVLDAKDDKGIIKIELYFNGLTDTSKIIYSKPYKYNWNILSIIDGSNYAIYAIAYDGDGNKKTSNVINVTTYKFQPSNLSAEFNNDTSATLRWNDNSSFETSFLIEISEDNKTYNFIKEVGANTVETNIKYDYKIDQPYYFRIKSRKDTLYSTYSNIASAKLFLNAPSEFYVKFLTDTSFTATWKDNCVIEKGFEIHYSTDNVNYSFLSNVEADALSKTIYGNFTASQNYYFKIRAKNGDSYGDFSNYSLDKILLNAPSELKVNNISNTSLELNWKDNCNYEKGYIIEKSTNGGQNYYEYGRTSSNKTLLEITNLDSVKSYRFRVIAYTSKNKSENSEEVEVNYVVYINKFELAHTFSVMTGEFYVSPDGSIIGIGDTGFDKTKLYKSSTKEEISNLDLFPLIFINNDEVIGYKNYSGFKKYNIKTNTDEGFVLQGNQDLSSIALSVDRNQLAIGYRTEIKIYDLATSNEIKKIIITNSVNAILYSPDGNYFIIAYGLKTEVYRTTDYSLLYTLDAVIGGDGYITNKSFSSDSKYMITCDGKSGENGPVKIWNLQTGTMEKKVIENGQYSQDAIFNKESNAIITSDYYSINVYRRYDSKLLGTFDHKYATTLLMRENNLYSYSNGEYKIWNTKLNYHWEIIE